MTPNILEIGETQVWKVPLTASSTKVADCKRLLSSDELARADRFVTRELRERFVLCRATLRQLLGASIGCQAQDVAFRYEEWGKPQLAVPGASLHFNATHSGDWGLIALSLMPVGIDLEMTNRRTNFRAIASLVLSDIEKLQYEELPHAVRANAILHLWVCKEAILKALGLGIAEGLQRISFTLPVGEKTAFAPQRIEPSLQMHLDDDGTCAASSWIEPDTWRIQFLQTIPGGTSAIATMRQATRISIKELEF